MTRLNFAFDCKVSAEGSFQDMQHLQLSCVAKQCYDACQQVIVKIHDSIPKTGIDDMSFPVTEIAFQNASVSPKAGEKVIVKYPNSTVAPYTAIVQKVDIVDDTKRVFIEYGYPSPYFTTFGWDDNGILCVDYNDRQYEKEVHVVQPSALTEVHDLLAIVGKKTIVYYNGDLQNQSITPSTILFVDIKGTVQCQNGGANMPKVCVSYAGNNVWWGIDAVKVDELDNIFLNYDLHRFGNQVFGHGYPLNSKQIPTESVQVGSEVVVYYGIKSTVLPIISCNIIATTTNRVTISYVGQSLHFPAVYKALDDQIWVDYDAREYDKVYVAPVGTLEPLTDMDALVGKRVIIYYGGDVGNQAMDSMLVMELDKTGNILGQNGGKDVLKVQVSYGGYGMWWGLDAFKVDDEGKYYLAYDTSRFGMAI